MISKIITRKNLSEQFIRLEIRTSESFNATNPGQYVILRSLTEKAGITLPIIKNEPTRETLTLIAPASDEVIALLSSDPANNKIGLEGPFGQAFRMEQFGSVLCIASYSCLIPLLPVISALRLAGNKITCLLTQNQGTNPIIESEIRKYSDNWITSDESQKRSFQLLEQTLRIQKFDQVIAIGQTKTVRETTNICTAIRMPIQAMLFIKDKNMSGEHGIFRVSVCGKTHSICVDGYNFDAHYTNFDDIAKRFGSEEPELRNFEREKIPV